MTYRTVTGYPFDGYDGTDESFERLMGGTLTSAGYGSEPDLYETIGRTDAIHDEQSAAERTVAGGRCTLCEEDVPELLPWSGQRLCWQCVDLNLDLLAKAVLETTPVRIRQGSLVRDDRFPEIIFTMEAAR